MKTHSTIAFDSISFFNPLVIDLLNKDEKLNEFNTNILTTQERIIQRSNFTPAQRNVLHSALTEQYNELWKHTVTNKGRITTQLNTLLSPNTFTVTTGHQLCLMTGPLYFVYKIITAINYTEQLNVAHPNNHFVPVYWAATEDHDFEEINHFNIYNKKLETTADTQGAVGNIYLQNIPQLREQLVTVLGTTTHATAIISLFDSVYTPTNTLAQATQLLVHELFAQYGLIIIDANNAALKQCMHTVFTNELTQHTAYNLTTASIAGLTQQGYKNIQVTPREINLFMMHNNKRERIIKTETNYTAGTSTYTLNQLQNNIAQLSPNVILRPLYQECILPNIAYVGGGGELAYWLELKAVFDYYNVPFPHLLLRHSVLIIDNSAVEKLSAMQLSVTDLFESTDAITKKYIALNTEKEFSTTVYQQQLEQIYNTINTELITIDKSLAPVANAELKKSIDGLHALNNKVNKALKQQHANGIAQALKQKEKYFPADGLQERYENIFQYINKYGFEYIDELKKQLTNATPTFSVLTT
ncbi:MAG: bacillithiol biosynthesis cysteine-adding enzyme BshC [Bacteroidia bacterium]